MNEEGVARTTQDSRTRRRSTVMGWVKLWRWCFPVGYTGAVFPSLLLFRALYGVLNTYIAIHRSGMQGCGNCSSRFGR